MSGDTPPYDIEREIDHLAALIAAAGGAASVFGYSSGAIVALMAGGAHQERMLQAAQAVAAALPYAEYRSLSGQTHDIVPEVLAPVLEEYFKR
jgi:pimeloyl-ACP methyl ester carboxylesterase